MAYSLTVTLIDVGWGDSILIKSIDSQDNVHFALIDSHDTKYLQPTKIYLKKYFKHYIHYQNQLTKPYFDFVLLSHDHADHRAGLENILKEFKSKDFFYPHTEITPGFGNLLDFAHREVNKENGCIIHHEAIDSSKPIQDFGDVKIKILWPPTDHRYLRATPNNTSIVLLLTLNNISVVLTGDAEDEVWDEISDQIPDNTRFFKVPHHGSRNGTFSGVNTLWFDNCPSESHLGISGNLSGRHIFPHPDVINLFKQNNRNIYRTDLHYHISFHTDGTNYDIKYFH